MAAVLADAPRQDDRLLLAIACSLVLHLAILSLLPGAFEPRARKVSEPRILTAHLVAPASEPAKAIEPPAPAPPQPAAKPHAAATQKLAARRVEPVAPPIIAVPPAPSAAPATVVPAPQPGPPVATASSPAPAAPAAPSGPDARTIKLYQANLALLADSLKRYPRVAVDNNWTGAVHLRILVGADGRISSVSVRESAGYAALDNEAQRMFRAALQELPVPPELRGWEFALNFEARFDLKD